MAWARPARARTSPTSRRRWPRTSLREFRDRFGLDIPDDKLAEVPFLRCPPRTARRSATCSERRAALGGYLPARRPKSSALEVPELSAFAAQLKATEDRQISTTMAFVRILNTLLRDKTDRPARGADRAG